MSDKVAVQVCAKLVNPDQARADAEDLAWDHSKFLSDALGIDMGSDEFADMFEDMRDRYDEVVDYLEFFTITAMLLLRTLVQEGSVSLNIDTPITDDQLAQHLGEISQTIVASYAWLFAAEDFMWPKNNEMPDDSGITFTFPSDEVIVTDTES